MVLCFTYNTTRPLNGDRVCGRPPIFAEYAIWHSASLEPLPFGIPRNIPPARGCVRCGFGCSQPLPPCTSSGPITYVQLVHATHAMFASAAVEPLAEPIEPLADASAPIPHIVHQTWRSRAVPRGFHAFVQSWQRSGWKHILHTDEDNKKLIDSVSRQLLRSHARSAYARPVHRA